MKPKVLIALSVALLLVSVGIFSLNFFQSGVAEQEDEQYTSTIIDAGAVYPTDDLITLNYQWKESILSESGWLHVKYQVDQDGVEPGKFPDGSQIPEEFISEKWYFLNDEGLVVKALSVMYDLNGKEIQTSIFKDRVWTNITFDLSFSGELFYPNLDNDLEKNIATDGFTNIEQQVTFIDDMPVIEVTTFEDLETPTHFDGLESDVTRIINRFVFDAENGAPIRFEMAAVFSNGQQRTVSLEDILVIERVETPPQQIVSLFEEVTQ